jgi:hypothetical protein
MTRNILRTALAAAIAAALMASGAAIAQNGDDDTTTSVSDRFVISGSTPSPIDFAGLKGDNKGKPLPKGYSAVGYRVSYTRGAIKALPTFVVRCPVTKHLVTMGASEGRIAPQVVGLTPFVRRRAFEYQGSRSWGVVVDFDFRGVAKGQTISGSVYGLCR